MPFGWMRTNVGAHEGGESVKRPRSMRDYRFSVEWFVECGPGERLWSWSEPSPHSEEAFVFGQAFDREAVDAPVLNHLFLVRFAEGCVENKPDGQPSAVGTNGLDHGAFAAIEKTATWAALAGGWIV